MANILGEIVWQANDNTWFTTNAAEVYPAGITIYHVDGRYKFTDGVTALGALTWRGDSTGGIQSVTGATVDNTDPLNPVVNVPTLEEVTASTVIITNPILTQSIVNVLDDSFNVVAALDEDGIVISTLDNSDLLFDVDRQTNTVNFLGKLVQTVNFDKDKNNFRLSLTSGLSVTTSDVVNAKTIYCTPHNGNVISLYNGTSWILYESNEFSLALGTLTNNIPYDIFCYANSGVPTLEFLAWTNTTTRATSLVSQDGILVKTGATTRRYLGTFLACGNQTATVTITNASPAVITYTGHNLTANAPIVFTNSGGALPTGIVAGQTYYLASIGAATANTFNISATAGGALINTSSAGSGTHTATVSTYTEDSKANRYLWNYYNQVNKKMFVASSETSHVYTTSTHRQYSASILNQLNFIQGLDNLITAYYKTRVTNTSANVGVITGIGLDYTNAIGSNPSSINIPTTSGNPIIILTQFDDYTGIGKHYLSALEYSAATGNTTWYALGYMNIQGFILC